MGAALAFTKLITAATVLLEPEPRVVESFLVNL